LRARGIGNPSDLAGGDSRERSKLNLLEIKMRRKVRPLAPACGEASAVVILYGPADVLRREKLVRKLEVDDVGTFAVEEGKRLVLAIEGDAGVDILHRCGSYVRCTTCRSRVPGGRAWAS
jgi:ferredoxin